MLHYAVVFLIIALIAAVFGFGGIASGAVGIAKILFFVFVIMAVIKKAKAVGLQCIPAGCIAHLERGFL